MEPESKYLNPSFSASFLAVVHLPLPAGQSIVIVIGILFTNSKWFDFDTFFIDYFSVHA